ncbi:MAG: pantoate--beta-alanine ligase [Planctomycetes bacterium]|nr:pantoate--beta-alanine ligase [Planctomycetota bacterium]
MIVTDTIAQTRQHIAAARTAGKTIGCVPTMGGLHQGHLSLIRRCRDECDFAVATLFVNPTQFAPNEDLDNYPRPFETDAKLCRDIGLDLIFAPDDRQMYPDKNLTWVNIDKISAGLCGASRPDHFRGVCTVVAKLFNIVTPDIAYFGQKDAQQLAIIRRMVTDLNFPIEIRSCPIVRDEDGLALSSRNQYLNPQQRPQAPCLYHALNCAHDLITSGTQNVADIISAMTAIVEQSSHARIDYISIVDSELLQPLKQIDRPVLVALAVYFGSTRLIDNIVVEPPAAKR